MSEENFQLSIPDMTCGSCASGVKSALGIVAGVDSAVINLSNRTLSVTGDVSVDELIKVIKDAGYTASELNLTTE